MSNEKNTIEANQHEAAIDTARLLGDVPAAKQLTYTLLKNKGIKAVGVRKWSNGFRVEMDVMELGNHMNYNSLAYHTADKLGIKLTGLTLNLY